MTDLLMNLGLMELNEFTVALRLLLAALCGGILGVERMRKRRAAGVRTYMLVCLGAATAMMTGIFLSKQLGISDPARIGAQVISGIGFIGAGTIMVTGYREVKGVTTAAGLWVSACMGLALGAGFYFGGILMCIIIFVVLYAGSHLESRYLRTTRRIRLHVFFDKPESMSGFFIFVRGQGIIIDDFESIGGSGGTGSIFTLKLPEKKRHSAVLEKLKACEGIVYLDEVQ